MDERTLRRGGLTHIDSTGRPAMVDVSDKDESAREASAEGLLRLGPAALAALDAGSVRKGDPLVVAQLAGIQAAKRTAELIPLCHVLPLSSIEVTVEVDRAVSAIRATATARVVARTGVEMEALTAVSVALLTAYDMLKSVDRGMRIEGIRLLHKSGGSSGRFHAEADRKERASDES
ncbi:MAG: cyclic pyranopterin monophosphate synthase MoaC [Longimicrobiales bacterium]